MQWRESFGFAWRALNQDKLKAFLTMLGIMIGSAAVVLVVTIALVGKKYVVAQIEGIGANLAYATLDRTGPVVPQDELSPEDLAAAGQLPGITAAAGTYDLPAQFNAAGKEIQARLVGVTEQFQQIRHLHITSGRYFDGLDLTSRDKVCLVTDRVAQRSFQSVPSAVGKALRLEDFRCTIIGTFRETISTFGRSEIQDETVLVPFSLIRIINGDNYFQVIYLQAESSADVAGVTDDFRSLLRLRHREQAKYSVDNLSSLLSTAQNVSIAMTAVLIATALVTLTAAGIGIMNIMLVNVMQRTHEIGIRRAIGAKKSDIQLQFLLEATLISVSGALLGIALALLLIVSVASAGLVPVGIPWLGAVLTILVATGTGILFGYQPAAQAARLKPIEALRAE